MALLQRLLCIAVLALVGAACSGGETTESGQAAPDPTAPVDGLADALADGPIGADPTPPELPDDFTWSGRYLVPDLDVDVPFTWHGADGDFQMIAGGAGEPIHFTNLIVDGELYTLTYIWPDVARTVCSHVGAFTIADFNEGLADASYAGREIHDDGRVLDHFRSVSVLELPEGVVPELDDVTTLRLPMMAADVYVEADDHRVFAKVLHFGLQNLYDPNLDEWIVIETAEPTPGSVELPEECAAAG